MSKKITEQNRICKKRKEFGSNNLHNAISKNKINEHTTDKIILHNSCFKV